MAKRKAAKSTAQAESYQHAEATVSLRPEVGTQAQFKKQKPPATYGYDSSLSPQLVCSPIRSIRSPIRCCGPTSIRTAGRTA